MERASRIRTAIDQDPYATAQGFDLHSVSDDTVTVEMTVRADQVNFLGGTHGGVVHSLADCAFSLASNAYPQDAVAIDTHLAITAASDVGDVLTAVAREKTRGRTLATYQVEVTRGDGRVVGLFTGTVFIKPSA
ncbi:MAG: PaaI family thioesterase [Acidimicrobiia bacterium]